MYSNIWQATRWMTKQDLTTDVYEGNSKMVRYSEFLAYALITQKTKIMYE